jgi:uncharacterized membrane protein YuzA (DUF378 family)
MFTDKNSLLVVQIVLIIAAVNWGLDAYNKKDAVKMLTNGGDFERYVKYAIAAVGLVAAYQLYVSQTKTKMY